MNLVIRTASLLVAAQCLVAFPAWAESSGHKLVTPADLKWEEPPSLPPGVKLAVIEGPMSEAVPFTARIKMPADYKIPAHWHPAVERVTVLSGTLYMGVGDKLDPDKSKALEPGSVMILPAKTNHFAWTKQEATIQLHGMGPWGITYVNPDDDPRKKK